MLEFGAEAEYAAIGGVWNLQDGSSPLYSSGARCEPAEDPRKKAEGAAVHRGLLSS